MNNKRVKILLAGETWVTHSIHVKGFDAYTTGTYQEGQEPFLEALEGKEVVIDFIPNHEATDKFPTSIEKLNEYDVVLLSDIGSNTLLLRPETLHDSKTTPNRLKLLREYVHQGGGFAMIGGYLSYQGFQAKANYHFTAVEEVLPVEMYQCDDRVELPSGAQPQVVENHPIVSELDEEWPILLGYNKIKPKGEVLVEINEDPLLVVKEKGEGKVAAYTSDCAPHWAPPEFVQWNQYGDMWVNLLKWLA